jgi:hypothetical protein
MGRCRKGARTSILAGAAMLVSPAAVADESAVSGQLLGIRPKSRLWRSA